MAELCENECPVVCPGPFERLIVFPSIRFGARIEWTMDAGFFDPHPWRFRLEVGRTGLQDADDWEQVGLPVYEAAYLFDDQDRVFGQYQFTHYRVRLETPNGNYVSQPTNCMGRMERRDWALALDMFRRARLGIDKRLTGDSGLRGWLLKRRLHGEPCTVCLDHLSRTPTDPRCPTCWGTGYVGGYFEPLPCEWAGIRPTSVNSKLLESLHMSGALFAKGQLVADPVLHPRDIFVASENDYRWGVVEFEHTIEVRGVPVLYTATMARLEFSDILYEIPIPGHPGPNSGLSAT